MKTLVKSVTALGLSAAIVASASLADSHAAEKLDPAVAARHHQMQMVGYHIGILGGTAKGEMEFDAAMVSAAAKNLNALATMDRETLWTEGTEQGATAGSRAKAEIWSDPDGFSERFKAMADASAALVDVSDLDALRASMGDLGGTCKACHEKYRGPKNE